MMGEGMLGRGRRGLCYKRKGGLLWELLKRQTLHRAEMESLASWFLQGSLREK